MSQQLSARDARLGSAVTRRGPGRPRRYDTEARIAIDTDLARRVALFAELEQISTSEAWRVLVNIGLNALERTDQ